MAASFLRVQFTKYPAYFTLSGHSLSPGALCTEKAPRTGALGIDFFVLWFPEDRVV